MLNNTWPSKKSPAIADYPLPSEKLLGNLSQWGIAQKQAWWVFGAACFLVSVPVFFQAPLVRLFPLLSLVTTAVWIGLSVWLKRSPRTALWGDLIYGFSWSWLAGSIYWGWFRWEPMVHIPIEAIGLPFALWGLSRGWGRVGNWFYLGSLFGTAVTDLYFYLVDLIPYWRKLMQVNPAEVGEIFHSAIGQVRTPLGAAWAIVLSLVLLTVGLMPLRSAKLEAWAFGGAVLSTILVDSLFALAALFA